MPPDDNPVIFVPGIMGSMLALGDQPIWGPRFPQDFNFRALQHHGPLVAVDVLKSVTIPPLAFNVYGGFLRFLRDGLKYTPGKNLFLFPYDWRLACDEVAIELDTYIRKQREALLKPDASFTIIAHSMGGLVARHCTRRPGMPAYIKRIITAGTPHQGSPSACQALIEGVDLPAMLPIGHSPGVIAILRSLPSVYHLLPINSGYLQSRSGATTGALNLADTATWRWLGAGLPRHHARDHEAMLEAARQANQRLIPTDKSPEPVPVLSIYGNYQDTLARINVPAHSVLSGALDRNDVHSIYNTRGDGVVFWQHAVVDNYQHNVEVNQRHESLLDDPDARNFIEDMLTETPIGEQDYLFTNKRRIRLDIIGPDRTPLRGPYQPGAEVTVEVGLVDTENHLDRSARFQLEVYRENDFGDGVARYRIWTLDAPVVMGSEGFGARQFEIPQGSGEYKLSARLLDELDTDSFERVVSFRIGTSA